jgi:hypothetical protein
LVLLLDLLRLQNSLQRVQCGAISKRSKGNLFLFPDRTNPALDLCVFDRRVSAENCGYTAPPWAAVCRAKDVSPTMMPKELRIALC